MRSLRMLLRWTTWLRCLVNQFDGQQVAIMGQPPLNSEGAVFIKCLHLCGYYDMILVRKCNRRDSCGQCWSEEGNIDEYSPK